MALVNDSECEKDSGIKDNWKHRSEKMKCFTCMWFVEKISNTTNIRAAIGRCRKHCPTMNGFPVMFSSDWCGDHKLDENKQEVIELAKKKKVKKPKAPEVIK